MTNQTVTHHFILIRICWTAWLHNPRLRVWCEPGVGLMGWYLHNRIYTFTTGFTHLSLQCALTLAPCCMIHLCARSNWVQSICIPFEVLNECTHETKDEKEKNIKGRTNKWAELAWGVSKLSGCVGPFSQQGAPIQTQNVNCLWVLGPDLNN